MASDNERYWYQIGRLSLPAREDARRRGGERERESDLTAVIVTIWNSSRVHQLMYVQWTNIFTVTITAILLDVIIVLRGSTFCCHGSYFEHLVSLERFNLPSHWRGERWRATCIRTAEYDPASAHRLLLCCTSPPPLYTYHEYFLCRK
jgi:hypothetical protein